MRSMIPTESTDDPDFIALVEHIAVKLYEQQQPNEVCIIAIKNWFDHKWLKFSGIGRVKFDHTLSRQSQTALDSFSQDGVTLPPFTPNRIVCELWRSVHPSWPRRPLYDVRQQHSSWNLQKRITQHLNSALLIWFSTGTRTNGRGSLMVYQVHGKSVSTWYASFRKGKIWELLMTKETTREDVELLMKPATSTRTMP